MNEGFDLQMFMAIGEKLTGGTLAKKRVAQIVLESEQLSKKGCCRDVTFFA
jgi:hypothetical protein